MHTCAPSRGAPAYAEQTLTDVKGETHTTSTSAGGGHQTDSKGTAAWNDTADHVHWFFSGAHGTPRGGDG